MSRRCPECGGLLGAGDAVCRACGHAVGPERPAPRAGRGLLEPRREQAGSIELGDLGPPPPRSEASPGGHNSSLGDMPAMNDADAFDLSAILDGGGIPSAPPPPVTTAGRGGFVPAFTFPGSDAGPVADLGNLDEATPDELSLEAAGGSMAGGRSKDSAAGGAGEGWRVRNAAGTVYDMVSIESVIQWLQNKDSFDGIRIARGGGAFRTVEDYPEVMTRLGMRPSAGGFSTNEGAAPKLELELAGRKPQGSRAPAAQRPESRAPAARGPVAAANPGTPGARTAARPAPAGRTFGTGFALVLAGGTVAVTLVLAQVLTAVAPTTPAPASAATLAPAEAAPPGPALQAALQAFEAERYTAAEQLLQQAARSEKDDPRVFRYLASTLSKLGGRDREARAALAEYRRTRARSGGE
jgi:hypothetical protein